MAEQKPTLLSPIIASTDASPNEEDDETRLRNSLAGRLLAGESVVGTGQAFEKWVALVRKRSGTYQFSGFPSRHSKMELLPLRRMLSSASSSSCSSAPEALEQSGTMTDGANLENSSASENAPEISLWERLGNSATLDIESSEFSWNKLSSLHHTEHSSSTDHSEDEMSKVLEVTINSGGVVFFAMFNILENNAPTKEAAAVIKIASSRMAIQSERLGYEFAKWLGVRTPQARLIHNSNPEWQQIKDAAEKARDIAVSSGDEVGEVTCIELLEALELSRCLLLMSYVHGPPMLDAPSSFDSVEAAAKTAAALGRLLMLDLVLRNEDRLPCRHLGWRGNSANLLLADRAVTATMHATQETLTSDTRRSQPQLIREIRKGKRAYSMSGRLGTTVDSMSRNSDSFGGSKHDRSGDRPNKDPRSSDFHIVAIDSGVPRRPPAGKRAKDQTTYPKFVELMLNNALHSSHVLHEITGGKVGLPAPDDIIGSIDCCSSFTETDITTIVHEFRGGFRAALRELQGFHLFLLSIYQKLDGLLRMFLLLISKNSTEFDNDEVGTTDSPATSAGCSLNSPAAKDRDKAENCSEFGDLENHRSTPKYFPIRHRDNSDSCSPSSRENWHGRNSKGGSGEPRLRLTMKLREFNKFAKVDAELSKELEQWNDMLKEDVIKVCQENNFNCGFFEGSDTNVVVDAYELKVRLEHILERITLISDAANTERPSCITANLFIGGTLCARSVNTLEYLGITYILCLCSNEIGQSDSQYPNMFEYKNLSISDDENADIGGLFGNACDYIDYVEKLGGKILVHCFEGRSRSATIVLAYLMLKKNHTLLEAWNMLKAVHRRAQPNDGFAKILLELDKSLHGKASMDWQCRRPMMRICPMCGKNAGLSSSSLKLHLQKSHPKLSSGSVDSAMTIEIHKALDALKASRGGSVSPNHKHHSFTDDLSQISL